MCDTCGRIFQPGMTQLGKAPIERCTFEDDPLKPGNVRVVVNPVVSFEKPKGFPETPFTGVPEGVDPKILQEYLEPAALGLQRNHVI